MKQEEALAEMKSRKDIWTSIYVPWARAAEMEIRATKKMQSHKYLYAVWLPFGRINIIFDRCVIQDNRKCPKLLSNLNFS